MLPLCSAVVLARELIGSEGLVRLGVIVVPIARAPAPPPLLAKRASGEIAGVEAFEIENRARLNVWIDWATVVSDITFCAYRLAATRIERSAVVADLTDKPARRCDFLNAGRYDRRAIMGAAIAKAKASRAVSGSTWGRGPLRDVWQVAKAARLVAAQ